MALELATSGARLLDGDRALDETDIVRFVAALADDRAVERELTSFVR
jgi:hypothetical protein